MKGILTALLLTGGVFSLSLPALAQEGRTTDPNLGHFYMARQQIQILDDAPQVFDKRTNPAAAQQQAGAIPRGPAPLPRAGFNAYSSSLPQGMGSSLPEVVNGVPRKMPQAAPASVAPRSGKAGAYKLKKAAAPKASGPKTAKTYAPYNGYGGGNAPVAAGAPGTGYYGGGSGVSGSSRSSSSNVKGSLLHWSRTRSSGGY